MNKLVWVSLAAGIAAGTVIAPSAARALPAVGSQAPAESLKSVAGTAVELGNPRSATPVLLNFFSPY